MKKLLMLTAIVCSLILSPVANAEWTKVGVSKSGKIHYVDLQRIEKHDGKVYYWELNDFPKPSADGTFSIMIYGEAECESFKYRFLKTTWHTKPMGEGKSHQTLKNASDAMWGYPSRYSSKERALKLVCNHKS